MFASQIAIADLVINATWSERTGTPIVVQREFERRAQALRDVDSASRRREPNGNSSPRQRGDPNNVEISSLSVEDSLSIEMRNLFITRSYEVSHAENVTDENGDIIFVSDVMKNYMSERNASVHTLRSFAIQSPSSRKQARKYSQQKHER